MTRALTRRAVMALLTAALATASGRAILAQTPDVTGNWTFKVDTGMGSGAPAITFKQSGESLTGTYIGTLGSADFTGTIKGSAIAFAFEVSAQGQTIDVKYTGTVDQDTMKGDVSMAGGQLTGSFTGARNK